MHTNMRAFAVAVVVVFAFLVAASAQQKRQQDVDLQSAIRMETVDGDLTGAIKQYAAIVSKYKSDRAVSATALLRMAECYQKLGDAQARTLFEQVLRDYADQTQAATIARARLGSPRATDGMLARQLWTTTQGSELTISGDGRRAAVVEGGLPDVQIKDLATGQVTTRLKVSTPAAPGGYAEWPVLSPDQTLVAYAYAGPDTKWNYQVRVAAAQPDAPARSFGSGFPYMYIVGWASDGKSVLATNFEINNVTKLAWVSTIDGTVNVVKTVTWQMGRPVLSPDGKFIAFDLRREQGKPDSEILILASDGSTESIVAPAPGVNASPIWSRDGSRLVFKSDRSGSFGIWSVTFRNGRADGPPTRLKADVGDVDLIGFTATASLLYAHRSGNTDIYAMDLDSQAGKVSGNAARVVETHLGSNLNPAASPDRKLLAYHRRTAADNQWSNLVIRTMETGAERVLPTVFRYAGPPLWADDGHSILQIARDVHNNRTAYKVDLKSSDVTRLISTGSMAPGATVSPDGRRVYAADTFADRAALAAIDVVSGARTEIPHLGSARAVAASPDGRSIAFVAIESGTTNRAHIYIAAADGTSVRPILTTEKRDEFPEGGFRWSPDSRFIYFLRGKASLWRITAEAGGTPALVGELGNIQVRAIDVTRDGRQVFFGTDSGFTVEVWSLENVLPGASPTARK